MSAPSLPRLTLDSSAGEAPDLQGLRDLVGSRIRLPLAAVRASLESLARGSGAEAGLRVLDNALEQLLQIQVAAEVLGDHLSPSIVREECCSIEEIARCSLLGLSERHRSRICLAMDEPNAQLRVDGPLLSRSLGRILDAALADGSHEILVHSHSDGAGVWFSIVDDLEPERHSSLDWSCVLGPEDPASPLGTGRTAVLVAARDIRRMGGSVDVIASFGRHHCVVVGLPAKDVAGETSADSDREAA
jgi:hypothetical protein